MSKSAKTRARCSETGQIHLSPEERVVLSQADADAAVAAAKFERDAAKVQVRQLQVELMRLEAEKVVALARARAEDTRKARRALADELAQRYAFGWDTHVYEPLTGAIVPLEQPKGHDNG